MALFAQHELDIVPLRPEDCIVVIGSYTGSTDLSTDKSNADAELAALFPARFKQACTETVSSNIAVLSRGAYDSDITALVYKNDVLLDSSTYTATAGTGTFSAFSPALGGGDAITATLVRLAYGMQSLEYDADFPVDTVEIKSAGTREYIYKSTTPGDSKFTLTVNGAYDIRKLRRTTPGNELEKSVFGSQWVATSATANAVARNTNPFFVAVIWWYPSATSGEVTLEKVIFYKCDLTKGLMPTFDGIENEAKYNIEAEATYVYRIKTLVS